MKTPDYMSYSKYKKSKKNNSQKIIVIFITTFFAMLFIFTAIANNFSPEIDVEIGEENGVEAKETGLGVKKFIDDRLKMIQMEDNMAGVSKSVDQKTKEFKDTMYDTFSKELDEKVLLPKSVKDETDEEKMALSSHNKPKTPDLEPAKIAEASRPAKVVVGYYNTMEQAKVAQGILMESGLNIAPFIKDLGGAYTLQVGSYSSREKANSLVSELLRNNFPARVIQE